MTQTETLQSETITNVGGRFLTFVLDGEEYGAEILKVREILGLMDITPVPQTPAFVAGVINLRGKVIPVIDLRSRFKMASAEATEETCVIVVDTTWKDGEAVMMGVVVDTVCEVVDIDSSQIDPPPAFGQDISTDYILGMGKVGEKVKILLDIDKVVSAQDMVVLQSTADQIESATIEEADVEATA